MAKIILSFKYGGKKGMVLFILTDHNIDISTSLYSYILRTFINDDSANVDDAITESLENIKIQRRFEELQYELTTYQLDDTFSTNDRYCLLRLDSIGTFCWMSNKMQSYMDNVLRRLIRVVDDYNNNQQ